MKNPRLLCGVAGAFLSSGAGAAAVTPGTQPAMPDPYDFLQSRSPFAHGSGSTGEKGALQSTASAAAGGGENGPDAAWVFEGIVQAGDAYTAFIENDATHELKQASVGDAIGTGRLTGIDLDALQFAPAEKSARTILLGQNLEGQTPPPPKPPPVPAAGGDGQSPAMGLAAGASNHLSPSRPGDSAPPGQVTVVPQ